MADPVFNLQQFLQSLAGDKELAQELLGAFMEDSPVRVASLGEALDGNDAATSAKLAHSLKGMCGVVRTDDLVSLALSMEHAAQTGDLDKVREWYAEFVRVMEQAHAEMQAFLDE